MWGVITVIALGIATLSLMALAWIGFSVVSQALQMTRSALQEEDQEGATKEDVR